jgi:hypothetical protein
LLAGVGLGVVAVIVDDQLWAVVATALATTLLAVFTAQLYSAAVAQLRASSRPLLVDVRPFAPPPADLTVHWGPDKATPEKERPYYQIGFPDNVNKTDWDARRPYVHAKENRPLRVSFVVRNVGLGLALILRDDVAFEHADHPPVGRRSVRYRVLAPSESTRINLVGVTPDTADAARQDERLPTASGEEPPDYRGAIQVVVPYTDLSGRHVEQAHFTLRYEPTQAWTRDEDNNGWFISDISYDVSSLTPLQ